tara:strand:+ start:39 stop:665 length:627 start_codon:yes stop_codon:yes gene_type:complete
MASKQTTQQIQIDTFVRMEILKNRCKNNWTIGPQMFRWCNSYIEGNNKICKLRKTLLNNKLKTYSFDTVFKTLINVLNPDIMDNAEGLVRKDKFMEQLKKLVYDELKKGYFDMDYFTREDLNQIIYMFRKSYFFDEIRFYEDWEDIMFFYVDCGCFGDNANPEKIIRIMDNQKFCEMVHEDYMTYRDEDYYIILMIHDGAHIDWDDDL